MFSFCSSLHSGVVSLGITEMQFSKLSGQNCVAFSILTLTKFFKPPTVSVWLMPDTPEDVETVNHTEFRYLLMPGMR